MFKPFEFCIPTRSTTVPTGPDWLHEIKNNGFRLRWSAIRHFFGSRYGDMRSASPIEPALSCVE
jgi:hypothetical protein